MMIMVYFHLKSSRMMVTLRSDYWFQQIRLSPSKEWCGWKFYPDCHQLGNKYASCRDSFGQKLLNYGCGHLHFNMQSAFDVIASYETKKPTLEYISKSHVQYYLNIQHLTFLGISITFFGPSHARNSESGLLGNGQLDLWSTLLSIHQPSVWFLIYKLEQFHNIICLITISSELLRIQSSLLNNGNNLFQLLMNIVSMRRTLMVLFRTICFDWAGGLGIKYIKLAMCDSDSDNDTIVQFSVEA